MIPVRPILIPMRIEWVDFWAVLAIQFLFVTIRSIGWRQISYACIQGFSIRGTATLTRCRAFTET